MLHASSALKSIGCTLMKIANDIRWLGSGPRCGIGELHLPENEPGSSIMPGKVNPTQCEALTMVCAQIMGYDTAITIGASQGNFELNVYKPMIAYNLLDGMQLLQNACETFNTFCITDLTVNEDQVNQYLNHSLMLVTALAPTVGYDQAAAIAHHAMVHHMSLKEATLDLKALDEETYDALIQPYAMAHPHEHDT